MLENNQLAHFLGMGLSFLAFFSILAFQHPNDALGSG